MAAFALLVFLFLVANRGAYRGYFDADDLDNLQITSTVPAAHFLRELAVVHFAGTNSRAAGFLFYAALRPFAGMRFAPYVAVLHAVHLLSAWLLWLLLRKLGMEPLAAGAGTLFWTFHAGMLDAFWRPMYCFDALLALFALASVLAYAHRRYVWSFVFFWLAFRSKEPGLMLPAVLVCYEFWFGERNWKRLAPFLLVSLAVGLQTAIPGARADRGGDYRVSFAPGDWWITARYYASQAVLAPYAGFAILAAALAMKDRRFRLGAALFCLLILPMLLLPGRISGAYLCAPLIGMAVVVAAAASCPGRFRIPVTLGLLLLWAPWNHARLRAERRALLAEAGVRRTFVTGLEKAARTYPGARAFVCDAVPGRLSLLGIGGALSLFERVPVRGYWMDREDLGKVLGDDPAIVLHWDPVAQTLSANGRKAGGRPQSWIGIDPLTPVWQLEEGWLGRDGSYRWTRPRVVASLHRPEGARRFELRSHAGADLLGRCEVRLFIGGEEAGSRRIERAGSQTLAWDLAPAPGGTARIEIRTEPGFSPGPGELLGLPVVAFGFR